MEKDTTSLRQKTIAVLTLRGKRKKEAPGAEWFVTTPEEIRELIQAVLGSKQQ